MALSALLIGMALRHFRIQSLCKGVVCSWCGIRPRQDVDSEGMRNIIGLTFNLIVSDSN